MTADYDPLTLPAGYFEGLPAIPNNLPMQPEPVELPVPTDEYQRQIAECERVGHRWTPWPAMKISGVVLNLEHCAHCGQCPERTRSAVQDALNGAEPRSA